MARAEGYLQGEMSGAGGGLRDCLRNMPFGVI
jgi:hypothetical protein